MVPDDKIPTACFRWVRRDMQGKDAPVARDEYGQAFVLQQRFASQYVGFADEWFDVEVSEP